MINISDTELESKLAYSYTLTFNKLFTAGLLESKHNGFSGEDALQLAKTYTFVHIARNVANETNKLKLVIIQERKKLAELQKQNDWQVERIKLLQEEVEFQKKLRTRT